MPLTEAGSWFGYSVRQSHAAAPFWDARCQPGRLWHRQGHRRRCVCATKTQKPQTTLWPHLVLMREAGCETILCSSFIARNDTGSWPKSVDIAKTGFERTKFWEHFCSPSCKTFPHRGPQLLITTISNLVFHLPESRCSPWQRRNLSKWRASTPTFEAHLSLQLTPFPTFSLVSLTQTQKRKKKKYSSLESLIYKLLLLPLPLHVVVITTRGRKLK